MSETKHLNRSYKINHVERYAFLKEYHKDQGINAPYKKSEAAFAASVHYHNMQKDLSEWINISRIEIDESISRQINRSITQE